MTLDAKRIEAVSFDSFSTLVDVESSRRVLEPYTEDPLEVTQTWRERALFYSVITDQLEEYETYYELHRLGLEYASELYGLGLSEAEIDELNEVYYDLEPFDDVAPVFEKLRDAGYDLYIVSNGDPKMLDEMVGSIGVDELLSETISADEIKIFKPAREIYEYAAEQAATPVERMVHVSAAVFDAQGAMNAGMQGVWINRKDLPQDPFGSPPDMVIESLYELTEALGVE
jgi:2-haloacid dehalogenase